MEIRNRQEKDELLFRLFFEIHYSVDHVNVHFKLLLTFEFQYISIKRI